MKDTRMPSDSLTSEDHDLTRRQALGRFAFAGAGLLALSPILAACGSESSTATGGTGTGTTAAVKVDKIGFSHPFPGTDIYRPLRKGLREAADKLGVQVLESQAEGKADKQLAEIRTWIASGVQGITILNIAGEGLGPVVKNAHEKDVKIVGYASKIDGEDGFVVFDNRQGAQLVAEAASKYIDENLADLDRIELGLLTLDSLGETGTTRVGGAVEILKQMQPQIEVVAKAEGTNIAGPAQNATRSMIQAHPDIKMMICISDDGQVGAYQALKQAGKQKDVWLAGYDGSRVAMQMILDNEMIGCTAAIPLRAIGEQSVQIPYNLIVGEGPTEYAAPYELVTNDTPELAKKLIADFE
jgi:ABC-type sugar transport system substrate-binding protein